MKYTLITLAALTGAAFAQTYNAGDVIKFANRADAIAGTNATFVGQWSLGWERSSELSINPTTGGMYYDQAYHVAAWDVSNVVDILSDGNDGFVVQFDGTGTVGGYNYTPGDAVKFANRADAIAGTNATFVDQWSLGWERSGGLSINPTTGGMYYDQAHHVAAWDVSNVVDILSDDLLSNLEQLPPSSPSRPVPHSSASVASHSSCAAGSKL